MTSDTSQSAQYKARNGLRRASDHETQLSLTWRQRQRRVALGWGVICLFACSLSWREGGGWRRHMQQPATPYVGEDSNVMPTDVTGTICSLTALAGA